MRWIYAVDPAYEGAEHIPPYAIAGAYPVAADGSPAEELIPNPDYRPSPRALGWPAPANDIEAAIQNAATGHGTDAAVRSALLTGSLFIDPASPVAPAAPVGRASPVAPAASAGSPAPAGPPPAVDREASAAPAEPMDPAALGELHAWTSDRYLPDAGSGRDWRRLPVTALTGVLDDRPLVLNPGTALEARLPASALLETEPR